MSLLMPWIGLALALGVVSLGCGLAIEWASGVSVARALLLPLGFAGVIVIAQALTAIPATAGLATPVVILVTIAGLVAGRDRARRVVGPWLIAAVLVYLCYGAPVLASGAATFSGYMALDDTAAWLSLVDHIMSHGRSLQDLTPSSYTGTLHAYLPNGYPLGGLLGLGVSRQLLATDPMWLYDPFLAYMGAMLSLGLYELARRLVARKSVCVAVAVIAAQPATLYGYALWGGIKEMVAAAMLPLIAALAGARRGALAGGLASARAMLPLAIACSALMATLSVGAIVWIVPLVLPAVLAGAGVTRRAPWRALRLQSIGWLALAAAVCSVPVIALAPTFLRPLFETSGPGAGGVFASPSEKGDLVGRLDLRQLAGIWPSGDFRLPTSHAWIVDLLIVLAVALAVLGVVVAWRRGLRALPAYVLGVVVVALAIRTHSSPWADAKSLSESSPAIVFAALCAVAVVWGRRELRWLGWIAGVLVGVGVLWSNVLAYSWTNLAPRDQLLELQRLSGKIAGHGPTLYPDGAVIGPRHILRAADADNPYGVRGRRLLLRDGSEPPSAAQIDIDDFDQKGLQVYRSLVLRRAPDASRPASDYRLRWAGRYFEWWERAPAAPRPLKHVTLGSGVAGGTAPCADVRALARVAGPRGRLATVLRTSPTVVSLGTGGPAPVGWRPLVKLAGGVLPNDSPGTIERTFSLASGGRLQLWLRGSARPRVTVHIDGRRVASLRHELNWVGRYIPLGTVQLATGPHRVTVRSDDRGPQPGNRGQGINPFYFGPLVLSSEPAALPVLTVRSSRAATLCGRQLDWIEALPGA